MCGDRGADPLRVAHEFAVEHLVQMRAELRAPVGHETIVREEVLAELPEVVAE